MTNDNICFFYGKSPHRRIYFSDRLTRGLRTRLQSIHMFFILVRASVRLCSRVDIVPTLRPRDRGSRPCGATPTPVIVVEETCSICTSLGGPVNFFTGQIRTYVRCRSALPPTRDSDR